MMINKVKKMLNIPLIWAFLIYLVLSLVYFSSVFLKSLLIAPGDSWIQNYPLRLYFADLLKSGNFSFWLPYEFLGTSLIGIMQVGILYPPNLIYMILPEPIAFNLSLILHFVLGALFMFQYTRSCLGLRNFPAFIAGLVFGFSGFLMAHKGHVSMMNAAIWLPLLLYLFEKMRTTLQFKYSIWAAIVIAVQIFAGHFQISVNSLFFLGIFVLFYWFQMNFSNANRFLLLALGTVILGVVLGAPQIIASKELTNDAWRLALGYQYFVEYSFPPFMLPTFIFPFIFGNSYGGDYWGAWNLTEMIGFIGVLPLFLGILVSIIYYKQNIHIKFWGIAAVITSIMAMGGNTPIYKIFYYIPVYNLFKVPARHMLEFDISISILFAFGLQYIFYDLQENTRLIKIVTKSYFYFMGATVFLLLVGKSLLISYLPLDLLTPQAKNVISNSLSLRNKAIYIPLLFISSYFIWLLVMQIRISSKRAMIVSLTVLVFLEAASFGAFYDNNWTPIEKLNHMEQIDASLPYLKEHAGYERSFYLKDRSANLYNVPLSLNKLNGYDPLINKDLHELLDMGPNGETTNMQGLLKNNLILSMLNTRYIVSGGSFDLSSYKANTQQEVNELPVPLGKWERSDAMVEGDKLHLMSINGKNVSIVQQKFTLKPNTSYIMSLKVETPEIATSFLAFDLFGEGYDSPYQELDINPEEMTKEGKVFNKIIDTGKELPKDVYIRVFTASTKPVIVENVKISELIGYNPPFFGDLKPDEAGNKEVSLYNKVFDNGKDTQIYENRNVLPKVFPVKSLKEAKDIETIKKALMEYNINPRETAMVSNEDLVRIGQTKFAVGELKIKDYQNDRVFIQSDFSEKGFAVLNDQFAPGWKAYIDGEKSEIYKVNGVLRGIVVPNGKHEIEIRYAPTNLYVSLLISAIFFALSIVGLLFLGRRKSVSK